MTPPLILITPSTSQRGVEFDDNSVSLSNQYCTAVAQAGGLPCIAPCIASHPMAREFVSRADGVLLTGGDDIQPELYDPRVSAKLRRTVSGTDAPRDLFELLVIRETFRQGKPLFAICRGQQMVNVAFGGTLLVDIQSQRRGALRHAQLKRKNEVVHDVELTRGSLVSKIVAKTELGVNSSHHQAVGEVAEPFRATARSSDGVIEALELAPGAARVLPFFLAVQFHPERLCARYPEHRALFQEFVRACIPGRRTV